MRLIEVDRNNLHGTLPASWSSMTVQMAYLLLQSNNFSGTLPSSWGNLTYVRFSQICACRMLKCASTCMRQYGSVLKPIPVMSHSPYKLLKQLSWPDLQAQVCKIANLAIYMCTSTEGIVAIVCKHSSLPMT